MNNEEQQVKSAAAAAAAATPPQRNYSTVLGDRKEKKNWAICALGVQTHTCDTHSFFYSGRRDLSIHIQEESFSTNKNSLSFFCFVLFVCLLKDSCLKRCVMEPCGAQLWSAQRAPFGSREDSCAGLFVFFVF